MNRRVFLKQATTAGLFAVVSSSQAAELSRVLGAEYISILHTNDVHSHLEPFEGGRYDGLGGVARRASLVAQVRKEMNGKVLLLDAGDIFQGTPYFNFFKGEPELKAMSAMAYDAATIGNHDFDAGIDSLAKQVTNHANFPFVNCNYEFSDTPMHAHSQEYLIKQVGRVKIGITGVGIELEGLVPKDWYGDTRYLDPISNMQRVAMHLKLEEGCDFVICLSHLGYSYRNDKISDQDLAAQTKYVDLIIGGHTHTFLTKPTTVYNRCGRPVLINQVGWGGIYLGRIDLVFAKGKALDTHCARLPIQ